MFPKSKQTQRCELCLSESVYRCVFLFLLPGSPSQALTRQLFPFWLCHFPPTGEIFPKGGALGKEGNLFLYPLYSFALAIC